MVEDSGAQLLKGLEQPLQLYRIVRPSGVRGRLEAAASSRGLTPFIRREDELRSLASRWERAREGDGQAVLISGEPGIGKSRRLHRFRETLARTPHTWIDAAASAIFQNTPFHPIADMLREAPFAWGDGSHDAVTQMAGALTLGGVDSAMAIPLLEPLLNLPLPSGYSPSPLAPDQQRRRLLATIAE